MHNDNRNPVHTYFYMNPFGQFINPKHKYQFSTEVPFLLIFFLLHPFPGFVLAVKK